MVGFVEKVADRGAAMLAPMRERSPLLGRESLGNLDVEVLHGGAGAVFGLSLPLLRCQELLPVERLGGEGLDRLLARSAHISPEGTHTAALVAGQLPNLLAPLGRKRAGIAEQVGDDDAGRCRWPMMAPHRTGYRAQYDEIDRKGSEQRQEQPAGRSRRDPGLGAAGFGHSRSSSNRSTCATARCCGPRVMPVMSSSTGSTPWERLETPRKTPSASEAASMPAALAKPVRVNQRGGAGRPGNRTTLPATRRAPPAAVMLAG